MAERKIAVKFGTEGVSEAIRSAQRVGREYDKVLRATQQRIEELNKARPDVARSGDARELADLDRRRSREAIKANQTISASFRELRLKSSNDLNQMRRQSISAYRAIRDSGVSSIQDVNNAQVALNERLEDIEKQFVRNARGLKAYAAGLEDMAKKARAARAAADSIASGNRQSQLPVSAVRRADERRQQSGARLRSVNSEAFSTLGIRAGGEIEAERRQLVDAFKAIKVAGVESAKDIARAQKQLELQMQRLDDEARDNQRSFAGLSNFFKDGAKNLAAYTVQAFQFSVVFGAINTITQSALAVLSAPFTFAKSYGEFETQLKAIAVANGSTVEEISGLRKEIESTAPAIGQMPQITARMAAELSRAGFTAEQTAGLIRNVGNAARGTNEDFSEVGGVLTNVIKQFELTEGQYTEATDILVSGSNASAAGILSVGEGMRYVGTQAAQSNQSLADTVTVIAALTDVGLEGSIAGTSYGQALERMKLGSSELNKETIVTTRGTKLMGEAIDELGVQFRQADGNLRPVLEIIPELRKALDQLVPEDQDILIKALFGTEGARAIRGLLAKTDEELRTLNQTIKDSGGVSQEAADQMKTSYEGAIAEITSQIEVLKIRAGEALAPAFAEVIGIGSDFIGQLIEEVDLMDELNGAIEEFVGWLDQNPEIVEAIKEQFKELVRDGISLAASTARELLKYLQENPQAIEEAIKGVGRFLEGMGQLVKVAIQLAGWLDETLKTLELIYKIASTEIVAKPLVDAVLDGLGIRGGLNKNGPTIAAESIARYPQIDGKVYQNSQGFIVPVAGARDSGGGGYDADTGLDFVAPEGTPVLAAAPGTLLYAEGGRSAQAGQDSSKELPGFQDQNSVLVKLDQPIQFDGKTINYMWYSHLRTLPPEIANKGADYGQPVRIEAGQVLGEVGIANNVPHLHFGAVEDRQQTSFLNQQQLKRFFFGGGVSPVKSTVVGPPGTPGGAPIAATSIAKFPVASSGARSPRTAKPEKTTLNSRQEALIKAANEIGMDPRWLAAIISQESNFDHTVWGGDGGNYFGLIQFGPEERRDYGAREGQSFEDQVLGPVVRFFKDRGFESGMTLSQAYATVLGGNPFANIHGADSNGTTPANAQIGPGQQHYLAGLRFLGGEAGLAAGGFNALDENKFFFDRKKLEEDAIKEREREEEERQREARRLLEDARRRRDERQQQEFELEKQSLSDRQKQAQLDLTARIQQAPETDRPALEQTLTQLELTQSYEQQFLEIDQTLKQLQQERLAKIADGATGESITGRDITAEINFLKQRRDLLDQQLKQEREIRQVDFEQQLNEQYKELKDRLLEVDQTLADVNGKFADSPIEQEAEQLRELNAEFDGYKGVLIDALKATSDLIATKQAAGLATEDEIRILEQLKQKYLELLGIQDRATASLAFEQEFYRKQQILDRAGEIREIDSAIAQGRAGQLQQSGDPFGAARLLERDAIASENLRFEQQLLDINRQVTQAQGQFDQAVDNGTDTTEIETRIQHLERMKQAAVELNQVNLQGIKEQFQDLGETIEAIAADALTTFFEDIFTNTKSVGEAFRDMVGSILQSIARLAAQLLVKQIFKAVGLGFSDGGLVPGFAGGGLVRGPGTGTSDSINAKLSKNEFVMRSKAVEFFGVNLLSQMNSLQVPAQLARLTEPGGGAQPTVVNQYQTVVTPDHDSFRKTDYQRNRDRAESIRRALQG